VAGGGGREEGGGGGRRGDGMVGLRGGGRSEAGGGGARLGRDCDRLGARLRESRARTVRDRALLRVLSRRELAGAARRDAVGEVLHRRTGKGGGSAIERQEAACFGRGRRR